MTRNLLFTKQFKKDYKRMAKRGADMALLDAVIDQLRTGGTLDPKYRDHMLSGDYANHHECHIKPDWLLIYYMEEDTVVLALTRTGTHNDLFS